MKAVEHCRHEKITMRGPAGESVVEGYRYGDFAVIDYTPGWAIAHVPSGGALVGNSFGIFRGPEMACRAMMEISKLKNTWAFIDMEELREFIPDIIKIIIEHRGDVPAPGDAVVKEVQNDLNGYGDDL